MTPWTIVSKAVTSASGVANLRTALFVVVPGMKSAMFFSLLRVHQNPKEEKNSSEFFDFLLGSFDPSFFRRSSPNLSWFWSKVG